jgi:hypothetical protein
LNREIVRLIETCLNKTHNKVCIGKHLSNSFSNQNGLTQGDVLSPLLFNCTLEYANMKVQENQVGLLANADDVNLLGDNRIL